jgi:type IV secretion system protein VirB4
LSENNLLKDTFHNNAKDFIPICCHYDSKTLLTKNGELIQTIQINGLNQENISKNLLGLREIIRASIQKNVDTVDLACWVHTIRRKVSLDDPTKYHTLLSQNIHDLWVKKNYWNDKFINTLFISFVHKGLDIKITDLQSFVSSFRPSVILNSHEEYLKQARDKLENTVSKVAEELSEFGCKRMGIYYKGEDAHCEMLTLFYGLLRGIEEPIKICETDLSKIIGSFSYASGDNKIEVIADNKRKYATILSLKEYQEVEAKALDKLLQQPTEFVITEIFHFEENTKVKEYIKHQNYILNISKDVNLVDLKGIKQMYDAESLYKIPFCRQQITVLLMNENIEEIEKATSLASFNLSRVGLVHVREDINLENSFWSQLPGNFKYLRRLVPSSVDTVAAMASLHNFPAGSHVNPWGRAITILRTERGTPFFFNFHLSERSDAKCLLVGNEKSGKTTLANFLVSESLKYDPAVLFVTYANDSEVFIKANGGHWSSGPYFLDPLKIKSIFENDVFLNGFILGMCGDNIQPLSEEEKAVASDIFIFFRSLPEEDRNFTKISEFDFSSEPAQRVKERMTDYLPEGKYFEYFIDNDLWENEKRKILSFNFEPLSTSNFERKYYPDEERNLPEYYKLYAKFSVFRELVLYTNIMKFLDEYNNQKQIIKLENFNNLCSATFSKEFYSEYFSRLGDKSIIYINSILFNQNDKFFETDLWADMQDKFESKVYLPAETVNEKWKDKLFISENEYLKLKSIIPSSRLFVVLQKHLSIACELSIGNLEGVMKILSADENAVELCNRMIAEKGENPNNWLIEYYNAIR